MNISVAGFSSSLLNTAISVYVGTSSKVVETDLNALRGSSSRVSKIQEKMCQSQDELPTSPTSPSRAKTESVYKPSVNMEDAVKWPQEMPGKLDFRKMEVFEGMLILLICLKMMRAFLCDTALQVGVGMFFGPY